VLSEDEKEIGVAVIDIGGGTTDLLLYVDGGIAHASVIPVGGNNITADISAGLRTPMGEAERLKRNAGCALSRMVGDDEEVEVPGVGGHGPRKAARRVLSDIIEPRAEEIFAVLRKRIEDTGMLEQLSAGVVLTGGAVLLDGMTEFAEEILGMPVRLGVPVGVRGITQLVAGPQYATGVGLVQYGAGALVHARERAASAAEAQARAEIRRSGPVPRPERTVSRGGDVVAPKDVEDLTIERQKSGRFWSWLRAAF
jgi:cell division protein FtsA